jgi:hypothetical protein
MFLSFSPLKKIFGRLVAKLLGSYWEENGIPKEVQFSLIHPVKAWVNVVTGKFSAG